MDWNPIYRIISGKYTRLVSPNTAHSERWAGEAVTVLAASLTELVGSFTHWLPSQEYSASVLSIAAPFSISVYATVTL